MTAAVVAALFVPVVLDRDDFPLATYPMYSRERDDVVCPAACIDHHTPGVEHVRLNQCKHASFGFSPDVLSILAERLATS